MNKYSKLLLQIFLFIGTIMLCVTLFTSRVSAEHLPSPCQCGPEGHDPARFDPATEGTFNNTIPCSGGACNSSQVGQSRQTSHQPGTFGGYTGPVTSTVTIGQTEVYESLTFGGTPPDGDGVATYYNNFCNDNPGDLLCSVALWQPAPAPVCSSVIAQQWQNPPTPTVTPFIACGGGRAGEPTCAPTSPPIASSTPIPTIFKARWTYQVAANRSGGEPQVNNCWSASCTGGSFGEHDELDSSFLFDPSKLGASGGISYPACGRSDCCNPSKAFDGSTTTFWAANPSSTQWNLYYNYGETTPANTEVTIAYYQPYYPGSVTMAISMDAVSWNTVITPTPTATSIRPGDPTPTPLPPTPTPNPTQTFTIIPAHRYIRFTFDGGLPYIREITTSKVGIISTPIPIPDTRGTFSPLGANPVNWTVPYPILATPTPDGRPNQARTPICTVTFFATDALGRNSNTCSVTGGWVDAGIPPTPSPTPIPMSKITGYVYLVNDNYTQNGALLYLDHTESCYTGGVTIVARYATGVNKDQIAGSTTFTGSSNCLIAGPYEISVPQGNTYNLIFDEGNTLSTTFYSLRYYDRGLPQGFPAPGNKSVSVVVPP